MTPSRTDGPISYWDVIQGTDEWHRLRCGVLTASEIKLILTPTLKVASNDKERAHLFELVAQRITQYVEPHYVNDDMMRGHEDEVVARDLYSMRYAEVEEVGFITNDMLGFRLGYSPDGLVGDNGLIEIKSRRQKYQIETILSDAVPAEHILQCQAGLLISGRKWLDYISYCGGMPMSVIRVHPDARIQSAIVDAAAAFEDRAGKLMADYRAKLADRADRLTPTERRIDLEIAA